MIANFLAEVAAEGPNVINTSAIVAVCSMVTGTVTGVVAWFMRGRQSRSVKIEGTPGVQLENSQIGVRLHEAWVSRSEFVEFKSEIKADVRAISSSVDKMHEVIMVRDENMRRTLTETAKTLSDKIESVASGAYESRRAIHEKVNLIDKKTEALAVKADIGKGLASLGSAIKQAIKPEQTKS
jgi:hypothetical protein